MEFDVVMIVWLKDGDESVERGGIYGRLWERSIGQKDFSDGTMSFVA